MKEGFSKKKEYSEEDVFLILEDFNSLSAKERRRIVFRAQWPGHEVGRHVREAGGYIRHRKRIIDFFKVHAYPTFSTEVL